MSTYTARLNNVDGPGGEADVGWVGGRFCYAVPVHIDEQGAGTVDGLHVDYYSDEHDDYYEEPEHQCPNLGGGSGRQLVHDMLRARGWEPVGSPWDDGSWEYITVHPIR